MFPRVMPHKAALIISYVPFNRKVEGVERFSIVFILSIIIPPD